MKQHFLSVNTKEKMNQYSTNMTYTSSNWLSSQGKILGACLEISQISDWRARVCGGMQTALVLWESCCIPSLLSGAGTWTNITTEHVKRLNKLQCWYLKLVLQTGPGAPSASLLWDTSILDMSLRVWKF